MPGEAAASMPDRDSVDFGDSLRYLRQEVDPGAAYTPCTFSILSRDRARLPNALLPLIDSVMGPNRDGGDYAPGRLLFDREQQRNRSPQLPCRSAGRTYRVVIAGNRCIHWLITHSEDATEAAADRHSPLLARSREPVRGDDGGLWSSTSRIDRGQNHAFNLR